MSALGEVIPGVVDARPIGSGGFGQVFRARQPAFDRDVAVKVLDGLVDDEATARRFRRECRLLGSLAGHPNIVGLHDAGVTASGRPYLVMPFLAQGSLVSEIERNGPLPWRRVLTIGVKLSAALHSAHLAGVLHRDLKPANILLSDYGEPLIADFGIAVKEDQTAGTTTSSALTPAFGAPELLERGVPTVATDVYSLTATLWSVLAGHSPFELPGPEREGDHLMAFLARIVSQPVPDLRPRGVPHPVVEVLEAGLAKDPARRLPSALALGQALQRAQRTLGLPVTALPLPDLEIEADAGMPVTAPVPPPSITPSSPAAFTPSSPPAFTPSITPVTPSNTPVTPALTPTFTPSNTPPVRPLPGSPVHPAPPVFAPAGRALPPGGQVPPGPPGPPAGRGPSATVSRRSVLVAVAAGGLLAAGGGAGAVAVMRNGSKGRSGGTQVTSAASPSGSATPTPTGTTPGASGVQVSSSPSGSTTPTTTTPAGTGTAAAAPVPLPATITQATASWTTATGQSASQVRYAADGRTLAVLDTDSTITFYAAADYSPTGTIAGRRDDIWAFAFAPGPEPTTVATGGMGRAVRIWDRASGKVLRSMPGYGDTVMGVEFSADGTTVAGAGWDGTVRLWNPATGAAVRTLTSSAGKKGGVYRAVFRPGGGQLAGCCLDRRIRVWDLATGAIVTTLTGHRDAVGAIDYSPDGTLLASGSWDGTARIWDAATGAVRHTLTGHPIQVEQVAFSPDGSRLATIGSEKRVRIWDVATGALLTTITGLTDALLTVAWSPDGTRLAAGTVDGAVWIWSLTG